MTRLQTLLLFMSLPILLLISQSCEKDQGPFIVTPPNTAPQDTNTNKDTTKTPVDTTDTNKPIVIPEPTQYSYLISFNTHVKPILQTNCMGSTCHNPKHPDGLDLRPQAAYNSIWLNGKNAPYVDTLQPKNSILYLHLVGIRTPMPKDLPKLAQGKIDTIYTWIAQGAYNN